MSLVKGIEQGSPEWLTYRSTRLTGSTVANVLGAGFGTPLSEYQRLRAARAGEPEPPFTDSPEMEWGRKTEPMHVAWIEEIKSCRITGQSDLYQDDDREWLAFSPDGIAGNGTDVLVEMKAPTWRVQEKWASGPPLAYLIQVQVGMKVLGLDVAWISRLTQPGPPVIYQIPRNQRFIDALMRKLDRFWSDHIERDIPPPATASKLDKAAIASLPPKPDTRMGGDDWQRWEDLDELQAKKRQLDQEIEERKNRLTQAVGAKRWVEAKKEIQQLERAS